MSADATSTKPLASIPHPPSSLLTAILNTLHSDLIPATKSLVATGGSPFGASILSQSTLQTITTTTNAFRDSPLLHGETNCIREFFLLPASQRPDASRCIFFSTHEPCSLCLSGIAWTGFPILIFLFPYEYTRDAGAIPEDIDILQEVFRVRAPGDTEETLAKRALYNRRNKFFDAWSVEEILNEVEDEEERGRLGAEIGRVREVYDGFSRDWTKANEKSPWREQYRGYGG
ncbi:hypothetical protein QBC34DRAFT_362678 [Podospora aff. communis PSN243]|uniref:CMP/dCMP-type deaminase domain-containing protein n=1 Tax=Podospora aff. communis PSN243 TaxID=3040156 RepID=A0AAV9G706_9PEZI|nr:hypothetical protein QBC34DRAFT_362678 [Podospora aff. communis PSN243]